MKDARGASDLPIRVRAALLAGGGALKALAATWRFSAMADEPVRSLRAGKTPIIFTLWHGQMLPLLWYHRDQGVAVLVSEHKDGEIIARILQWMGYALIRGSTSRGSGRALLGLVRTLREGNDVAITPDGPRGPRHMFAPGAAIAAQRSGAPVVPAVAHVDRYWQLRTWDGFIIPKPFARITVAYGEPTRIDAGSPREAAEAVPTFERLMAEASMLASA